ncbi:MAG: hypothetical protein J5I98_25050, partial [Phaeodactylibacter sp.]|nr:hypothetical protein [Phaeodactylibacter sp.]
LGAGYYRLAIIDNNGCRGEVPFTVEGEDVEISYGTSPECEHRSNGTIWLQAYVPAPGHNGDSFHYEWSTGDEFDSSEGILLEGLAAGQYTVAVTNQSGDCSYTETIEVRGFVSEAPLSVEAEIINTCPQYPSGYIELHINGGVPHPTAVNRPYSIQWEDFYYNNHRRYKLEEGSYSIAVRDFCDILLLLPLRQAQGTLLPACPSGEPPAGQAGMERPFNVVNLKKPG